MVGMRLLSYSQRFSMRSPRQCKRLFVSREDLPNELISLRKSAGIRECLILSTCLRFEIYAVLGEDSEARKVLEDYLEGSHGFSLEEIAGSITAFEGTDVVRHLFSVACGLDSEILGEKQVVKQIKNAYGVAHETGTTAAILNRLFQKSLNVSKRVRTRTGIDVGACSAASLAVRRLSALHGDLFEKKVLILGAGQMGKLVGMHLGSKGCKEICITSRSVEHARATAEQCGARSIPFNTFFEKLEDVDILVTATGAPHLIFGFEDMEETIKKRGGRSLCIIDLAEPPDVDGRVADLEGITYITIGEVNKMASETRDRRTVAACEARTMVDEAAEGFTWVPSRKRETVFAGK